MTPTKTSFFIERPHVPQRMRERAGFAKSTDDWDIEQQLRQELIRQLKDRRNLKPSRKDNEYAVRIAISGYVPVYAILAVHTNEDYDYHVPTVVTEEMYQAWCKDGKLCNVQERVEAKGITVNGVEMGLPEGAIGVIPSIESSAVYVPPEASAMEAKPAPTFKPTIHLRYVNGDGSEHFDEVIEEDVDKVVWSLLQKGVRLLDIEAYRRVQLTPRFNID